MPPRKLPCVEPLPSSHMSSLSEVRRQKRPCIEVDSGPPAAVTHDQLHLHISEPLPSLPFSSNLSKLPPTRKSRGTGLKINTDPKGWPSNRVICASPAPKTRRTRRTHAEMAAAVQLTGPMTPVSPIPKTRRPKRTRAEMAAVAVDNVATSPPQLITYRRRHTQNEASLGTTQHLDLPLSRAVRSSALPKSRRTCFELHTDRYTPASAMSPPVLKAVVCDPVMGDEGKFYVPRELDAERLKFMQCPYEWRFLIKKPPCGGESCFCRWLGGCSF